MKKAFAKVLSAVLAVTVLATMCLAGCSVNIGGDETTAASYTYKTYSTALGDNWNPHNWEDSGDDSIRSYLYTPFVTMSIKDSENAVYQWIYEAATSVTDVTADHQDDLTKYGSIINADSVSDVTSGYVFEIKLREGMTWEDGTVINADSYITSMKYLLDPTMLNYRANLYIGGTSAVAGAYNYYYALTKTVPTTVAEGDEADALLAQGVRMYFDVYEFYGAEGYTTEDGQACPQYLYIDDETNYATVDDNGAWGADEFNAKEIFDYYYGYGYFDYYAPLTYDKENENYNENYAETYDSSVGVYKVDDYTIRYVCERLNDFNYFLTSLTDNWLVYESLYESCIKDENGVKTTTYCTSVDTTKSYGPYKLVSLQSGKQVVFEQNENWYGYTKNDDGSLVSYTEFLVDGEHVQQYQTTKIVIDVMDDDAAKLAFMKGELTDWSPASTELSTYATSDRLYKVDETYTQRLFFNDNLEALQNMDATKGNKNSVVLSNYNFRKAMSYAIDRSTLVTVTSGYKPAFYLLNSLYYYNIYDDPDSQYRASDAAKQAMVDLYGVEYGVGKTYTTLDEAYESITGYNKTEAQNLFKTACEELVADGLYTAGEEIKIQVAWCKGTLTADDNSMVTLLQKFLNEAMEGSGFGTITLEPIGELSDRYAAVPAGDYAIGYGAWGGAAFYPFSYMEVYLDASNYELHEGGCFDPSKETWTFNVDGEDVTMTMQEWSQCMDGGVYTDASYETRLEILADMEKAFLELYHCIPLCTTTACSMLSYQVNYYTDVYNIMYDFGGLRLMEWQYNDTQWAEYIAEQGGTLNYQ